MRVLVIGDSCEDVFIYGEIERMSPEAPVPILQPIRKTKNGGISVSVVSGSVYNPIDFSNLSNESSNVPL